MNWDKRNILGDLIMSTVLGCATLFALLVMCVIIGTTLALIISFLKQTN
jgi:hypothetical protein